MKRNLRRRNAGFTLIELVIVVLIIGILGAIMIPQYAKTVESSKADDAASVVTMIGQANRMFRVDNNTYVANNSLVDSCNSTTCTAGSTDRCQLIACSYLGSRKWEDLPYSYQVGASVNCGIAGAPNGIACGRRNPASGNPQSPYDAWGYVMSAAGIVTEYPVGPCATCPPKASN